MFAALGALPTIPFQAGLPDGLVSNQTPSFGTFWKALEWKNLTP
jgi:hypothetical protein